MDISKTFNLFAVRQAKLIALSLIFRIVENNSTAFLAYNGSERLSSERLSSAGLMRQWVQPPANVGTHWRMSPTLDSRSLDSRSLDSRSDQL